MRTFHVKNFERFQHYRDRDPPWIKLYNSLLEDYGFACLPDTAKWHLCAIWLLASRTKNRIPCDAEWLRGRLNASSPVDLPLLLESGFIELDQDCSEKLSKPGQDASKSLALARSRETETEGETETEKTPLKPPKGGRTVLNGHLEDFELWYAAYPRKVARGAAERAFAKAIKTAAIEDLIAGATRYAKAVSGKEPEFVAHPATWLNGKRWLDGDGISKPRGPKAPPPAYLVEAAERANRERSDD